MTNGIYRYYCTKCNLHLSVAEEDLPLPECPICHADVSMLDGDIVEVTEYVHNHYYDGWYQYRYKTRLEAEADLDRLHRRQTCTIDEVKVPYRRSEIG